MGGAPQTSKARRRAAQRKKKKEAKAKANQEQTSAPQGPKTFEIRQVFTVVRNGFFAGTMTLASGSLRGGPTMVEHADWEMRTVRYAGDVVTQGTAISRVLVGGPLAADAAAISADPYVQHGKHSYGVSDARTEGLWKPVDEWTLNVGLAGENGSVCTLVVGVQFRKKPPSRF